VYLADPHQFPVRAFSQIAAACRLPAAQQGIFTVTNANAMRLNGAGMAFVGELKQPSFFNGCNDCFQHGKGLPESQWCSLHCREVTLAAPTASNRLTARFDLRPGDAHEIWPEATRERGREAAREAGHA